MKKGKKSLRQKKINLLKINTDMDLQVTTIMSLKIYKKKFFNCFCLTPKMWL